MTMKDRWERLVEKVIRDSIVDVEMLSKEEVVKLLRQEHQAVVRMVKRDMKMYMENAHQEVKDGGNPFEWDMKREACQDILDALAKRAR